MAGSEMITVNSLSRAFRTIPKSDGKSIKTDDFADHIKRAETSLDSEDAVKREMSADEYRQVLSERIQSLPFDSSNRMDSTMISISDAGIKRMMSDSKYESWVIGQIKSLFKFNDPFSGLAGGKMNIIRVGADESDFKVTMERAGFKHGQDSMIPKVYKDDKGFWMRRLETTEEQLEMAQELQMEKEEGDGSMPNPMLNILTGMSKKPGKPV